MSQYETVARTRLIRKAATGISIVLGIIAATAAAPPAVAAENPFQRGPDPTPTSVAAPTGPFATASVQVPRGNGFGGGVIYHPTATNHGTFGGLAISPGLNDSPTSRGTQLLAALDYLTRSSSVRGRVDANRLAVAGHSMGGGGALDAALRRPALKATIGNAPFLPSNNLSTDRVPTLIYAMQNDTLVTPSRLTSMYNTIPGTTEKAYIEVAGAGHNFIGQPSTTIARTMIPWLKIFIDNDTRYSQFLCPMADRTGVSQYRNTCPLITTTG